MVDYHTDSGQATINAAVKDHLEPPLLKSSPLFTS